MAQNLRFPRIHLLKEEQVLETGKVVTCIRCHQVVWGGRGDLPENKPFTRNLTSWMMNPCNCSIPMPPVHSIEEEP